MSDLAQRFPCNIELAGSKPTSIARIPVMDEIRPPLPDERASTNGSRDSLCVEIAVIALAAAIAVIVILGFYIKPADNRGNRPQRSRGAHRQNRIEWERE